MKYVFIILLFITTAVSAQVVQETNDSRASRRVIVKNGLLLPKVCNPTTAWPDLLNYNGNKGAIVFDSCNNKIKWWNGSFWDSTGAGGGIGDYVDTIYRKPGQDSIFFTINGGAERAIKDSTGGGGGMTNPMTTTGDIIYSSDNSGTPARLGIGATGNFLTVTSGLPAWSTNTTGILYIPGEKAYVGTTSGNGSNGTDGGTNANSHNFFIGDSAGNSITTGIGHVAIGYKAMKSMSTDLISSIAIGNGALENQTATGNIDANRGAIAIGADALNSSTSTTVAQLAIGRNALKIHTGSSGGNLAIGTRALESNISGEFNVAVGSAAFDKATGSYNTAIGYQAGVNKTSGSNNTYVGFRTGNNINTGNNNQIFGSDAFQAAGSGGNNVVIGQGSGVAITNGNSNTIIGHQSGRNISTGGGNIIISSNQPTTGNITTGGRNVVIGDRAAVPSATAANQFAIGMDAINWIVSDLSGSHRRWALNGTTTNIATIAEASATLNINSTLGGLLIPRLTTAQRNAISSPANGLIVFCTDCTATDGSTGVSQTYSSTAWRNHY